MKLGILGSTGSIGTQALTVAGALEDVRVVSLTAARNIKLLEQQIRAFRPNIAAVLDAGLAMDLKVRVADTATRVVGGEEGILEAAVEPSMEMLLTSVVGIAGLAPTAAAISAGKHIALANKETIVTAGACIMNLAKEKGVSILPVDSEHCAIFQCMRNAADRSEVRRLILTASGGPFFGKTTQELAEVTVEQALSHPQWSMGKKISVDSATLMNKGFEVIEARWLFGMEPSQIDVVVQRESIIHSMVEFVDGSVMAQMSYPDMKLPIQYALTYPKRLPMRGESLDFARLGSLSFAEPDDKTFPCLRLAYDAMREGGSAPAALNAANEVAVELFLDGKIKFLEIAELVAACLRGHKKIINPGIEDILEIDTQTRAAARSLSLSE